MKIKEIETLLELLAEYKLEYEDYGEWQEWFEVVEAIQNTLEDEKRKK